LIGGNNVNGLGQGNACVQAEEEEQDTAAAH